jgi:preprotein translocase subunit SecE
MSAQAEEVTSVTDIVKLVLSPIFVVAGVTAFYYFSDIQMLFRVLLLVAVIATAIGICFTTARGQGVWGFMLESKQEFNRVVWPTKDEAIKTTLLVFLMVLIVGFVLWVLDTALFWVVQYLMSLGVK